MEELVVLRANAGQLHFALPAQSFGRKGGIQNHICQQLHTQGRILAHYLSRDTKGIIAAIGIYAATHIFDLFSNLLACALGRAFDQQLGHQLRDAAITNFLGQYPALKHTAQLHKRQAMIFLEQQG